MKKAKYNFYLNPYDQYKWTKCPKCDTKTKIRKFCLVINYKEKAKKPHWKNILKKQFQQLFSLNKTCKYCSNCELIIGQKTDLDSILSDLITQFDIAFNPNDYRILGTMDKKEWVKNQKEPLNTLKLLTVLYPFEDIWEFEIQHAGWYFDGK